jgi:4-amino-4-deoxy-L-arabinose transferase-like glycosyltransferase
MSAASSKFYARAVVVLIGLLLLARLIGMAAVPLMDTTEARYGEIGRKMAELNDWVTPWFDYGVPYWGKPPLAFWVTAISFKLFGVNEFDARLPHLICSILIVGVVAWLARRRDRDAALPTVALMSGSFLYFISAGAVMTDIELVLGAVLAMAGFWLALEPPAGDRAASSAVQWNAGALFFGGLILGLLSKGPVALVLAGAPLFLWTLYNHRWLDVWRRLPWVSGTVLMLLIALPWYWAAEHRTPGFLEYFLVGEHWRRFITPGWSGDRYGNAHVFPIGSIWVFALIDTLPWSLLLPLAIWRWRATPAAAPPAGRSDEPIWQGYLLAWALMPLLIFTAARNIIMTYALPALPAATILAGGWLARQYRRGHDVNRWLSAGLLLTLLTMCGLAVVDLSQPDKMAHRSAKALLAAYDHATAGGARGDATAAGPASAATPLIFIWSRPFSSEFYSHGLATKVANDDEAWRSIGSHAAFVVTRWPDAFIDDAAHASGTARAVTRIGHYGDFDLLFIAAR